MELRRKNYKVHIINEKYWNIFVVLLLFCLPYQSYPYNLRNIRLIWMYIFSLLSDRYAFLAGRRHNTITNWVDKRCSSTLFGNGKQFLSKTIFFSPYFGNFDWQFEQLVRANNLLYFYIFAESIGSWYCDKFTTRWDTANIRSRRTATESHWSV